MEKNKNKRIWLRTLTDRQTQDRIFRFCSSHSLRATSVTRHFNIELMALDTDNGAPTIIISLKTELNVLQHVGSPFNIDDRDDSFAYEFLAIEHRLVYSCSMRSILRFIYFDSPILTHPRVRNEVKMKLFLNALSRAILQYISLLSRLHVDFHLCKRVELHQRLDWPTHLLHAYLI